MIMVPGDVIEAGRPARSSTWRRSAGRAADARDVRPLFDARDAWERDYILSALAALRRQHLAHGRRARPRAQQSLQEDARARHRDRPREGRTLEGGRAGNRGQSSFENHPVLIEIAKPDLRGDGRAEGRGRCEADELAGQRPDAAARPPASTASKAWGIDVVRKSVRFMDTCTMPRSASATPIALTAGSPPELCRTDRARWRWRRRVDRSRAPRCRRRAADVHRRR